MLISLLIVFFTSFSHLWWALLGYEIFAHLWCYIFDGQHTNSHELLDLIYHWGKSSRIKFKPFIPANSLAEFHVRNLHAYRAYQSVYEGSILKFWYLYFLCFFFFSLPFEEWYDLVIWSRKEANCHADCSKDFFTVPRISFTSYFWRDWRV